MKQLANDIIDWYLKGESKYFITYQFLDLEVISSLIAYGVDGISIEHIKPHTRDFDNSVISYEIKLRNLNIK